MRKTLVLAVLAFMVLASLPLAQAADSGDQKWTFEGQIRTREEHLENYADFDNNGATSDLVDFMPFRAQMGVNGVLANNVTVAFMVQSFGVWGFNGDPRQSSTFPPTQQSFTTSPDNTSLYKGAVTLNHFIGKNFTLTVGRQEHMEGTGLIFGNEEFYNGTVYDGAVGEWKFKSWELTGLAFIVREGFDPTTLIPAPGGTCTTCGSDDTRVWGATGHLHFGNKLKSDLDVYGYDSYEGVPNTPVGKPRMQTYGAHWWRMPQTAAEAKKAHLEWNVELAVQSGKVTDSVTNNDFNTSGSIFDGEAGWNFTPSGNIVHKVYVGAISESGDKDLTNNKIEGWTDLFMSVHNRFGAADFFGSNFNAHSAGITAVRVGYMGSMKDGKHMFGATFWTFQPTEDKIKVAPGTTVKLDDYGTEIDAGYKYRYTDNVSFGAGIAQLKPKKGLADPLGIGGQPTDPVLRVVGSLTVHWK